MNSNDTNCKETALTWKEGETQHYLRASSILILHWPYRLTGQWYHNHQFSFATRSKSEWNSHPSTHLK